MVALTTKNTFVTKALRPAARKQAEKRIEQFEKEGFVPAGRRDLAPSPIKVPFDWGKDPFRDPNWRMQLHAWRMLDPYLVQFEDTGDQKYLKVPISIAEDWLRWVVEAREGYGRAWYDMAVGLRGCKIALLGDWCQQGCIDRRFESLLKTLALLHINHLSDSENFNSGNHGIFQAQALRSLSKLTFLSAAVRNEASRIAVDYLSQLVKTQFDEEGLHREGAPEYHFFGYEKLSQLVTSSLWSEDELQGLLPRLEKARENRKWLITPQGVDLPIGDTSSQEVRDVSNEWYGQVEGPKSAYFKSGWLMIRDCNGREPGRDSLFAAIGGRGLPVHRHNDQFSCLWYCDGEEVLIDAGKYGYKKDKFRKYVISPYAHNTLTVVGQEAETGLLPETENKLSFHEIGLGAFKIEGRRTLPEHTVHQRVFLVRPKQWLVVLDRVVSFTEKEYEINWHLPAHANFLLNEHHYGRDDPSLRVDLFGTERERWAVESFYGHESAHSIKGWRSSRNYRELTPCYSVSASIQACQATLVSAFKYGGGDEKCIAIQIRESHININDEDGYKWSVKPSWFDI